LKEAVDNAVQNWESIPLEHGVKDSIYGNDPLFVQISPLDYEVLDELKSLHEQWSGLELIPTSAYGVRLYLNGSTMVMHYDKVCFFLFFF
jgi:hypothetical protein